MSSAIATRKSRLTNSTYTDAAAAIYGQTRRLFRSNLTDLLRTFSEDDSSGVFQARVTDLPRNKAGIESLSKLLRRGLYVSEGLPVRVGDSVLFNIQSRAEKGGPEVPADEKSVPRTNASPAESTEALLQKCSRFLSISRVEKPVVRVVESRRSGWVVGFPVGRERPSALQGIERPGDRFGKLTERFLTRLSQEADAAQWAAPSGVLQSLSSVELLRQTVEANALFQTIEVSGHLPEELVRRSAKETIPDAFVLGDDEVLLGITPPTGVTRYPNRDGSVSNIRRKIRKRLNLKEEPSRRVRIGVVDSGLSGAVAAIEFEQEQQPRYAGFDRETGSRITSGTGATFHDFLGESSAGVYFSHGTSIAVLLAGRSGIAPTCDLAVAGIDFSRDVKVTAVQNAISWLADVAFGPKGLDVLSLSLNFKRLNERARDVDAFLKNFERTLEESGFHCFAAVGNSPNGDNHGTSAEPAARQPVNAVGAVDANGDLAYFSNYRLITEGNFVPEYLALGTDVQSIDANGRPFKCTGTSFATPIVAASAALVLQAQAASSELDKNGLYKKMERIGALRQIGRPRHQGKSLLVPST